MDTLKDLINYFVIICDVGGGVRFLYSLIRMTSNPDEVDSYLKKITHLLIFLVLANISLVLKELIEGYFT